MRGNRVAASRIVLYEDAAPFFAVHVAGNEVKLLPSVARDHGQVAYPGHLALSPDSIHHPEPPDFGQLVARPEKPLDALYLSEKRLSVGGGGEAEAEQQRPALAEGRAL